MLSDREEIVMLRQICRLAQAHLNAPYLHEHSTKLAAAIREYEEAKRWRPQSAA